MIETRDDLREALADQLWRRFGLGVAKWQAKAHAEDLLTNGPLAPILAQVSALQAENRDLRLELAEAKQELDEADARHSAAENAWSEATARVSALQAEVERLQRERDEAREVVALCNNSFGSYSYHTSPHPAEQIEKIKEQARSEWRRAEEALERLQKVEGERERLGRALGVSVAVLDRAAGEGIMFLPGDDGSPEMDAADACEIISTVIEAEIDGPVWRALLATGWKRLSPSDNPLTEAKEGSEHV